MAEFAEVMEKWGKMCREINLKGGGVTGCSTCSLNMGICNKIIREYDVETARKAELDILEWHRRNDNGRKPTWLEFLVEKGFIDHNVLEATMLEGDKINVEGHSINKEMIDQEIPDCIVVILEKVYGKISK